MICFDVISGFFCSFIHQFLSRFKVSQVYSGHIFFIYLSRFRVVLHGIHGPARMLLFVPLDIPVDYRLSLRQRVRSAFVFAQHAVRFHHVDIRFNGLLRCAHAVVVIHFEVDQRLPVSFPDVPAPLVVPRRQAVASVPVVREEVPEFRLQPPLFADLQIPFRVCLSVFAEVPVFLRHDVVLALVQGNNFIVPVRVDADDMLLILEFFKVVVPFQGGHLFKFFLAPSGFVERNDKVDPVVAHCRDDMVLVHAHQDGPDVFAVPVAQLHGLVKVHAFRVAENQLPVFVQSRSFAHQAEVDLDSRITENPCEIRHLRVSLAFQSLHRHVQHGLHHVDQVRRFKVAETLHPDAAHAVQIVHHILRHPPQVFPVICPPLHQLHAAAAALVHGLDEILVRLRMLFLQLRQPVRCRQVRIVRLVFTVILFQPLLRRVSCMPPPAFHIADSARRLESHFVHHVRQFDQVARFQRRVRQLLLDLIERSLIQQPLRAQRACIQRILVYVRVRFPEPVAAVRFIVQPVLVRRDDRRHAVHVVDPFPHLHRFISCRDKFFEDGNLVVLVPAAQAVFCHAAALADLRQLLPVLVPDRVLVACRVLVPE